MGFCDSFGSCRTNPSDCPSLGVKGNSVSCNDIRCFRASGCVQGAPASTANTANVCIYDWSQGGCPAGQACGPSNMCENRKANGATCSVPGECLSSNCVGGYCCSASSCPTCQSCSSGICAAISDGPSASCPSVTCDYFVSGWVGSACASYAGVIGGYCSGGSCDTSAARCASTTTSGRPSCGSANCLDSCPNGSPASSFSTVGSVCYTSGQAACGTGFACDSTGSCVTSLLANGASCSSGSQCQSSICSSDGFCCSGSCSGPCKTCSSGSCANRANGAWGGCSTVDCSLYVGGWAGTICAAFTGALSGSCSSGACIDMTSCSSTTNVGRPACGSTGCMYNCPSFSLASTYSSVASVCYTAGTHGCSGGYACDSTGTCVSTLLPDGSSCSNGGQCSSGYCSNSGHCCPTACTEFCQICASGTCVSRPDGANINCNVVPCSDYVSTWNGLTCSAYTGSAPGYCQSGYCETSLTRCPGQTSSGRPSCSSAACKNICPTGSLATSYATVAAVCYTSGMRGCNAGQVCDSTGACITALLPDGSGCASSGQCQSGHCSYSGHCCSTSCSSPCAGCTGGTCAALSDGPNAGCSNVDCAIYLWGFSGLSCSKYIGIVGGYCTSGACDNSPSRCAGQGANSSGRPQCGSGGCLNYCPTGGLTSSFPTIASVCFTSGQHGCSVGSFCDTTGTCISTLLSNGQPCADGSQCSSGICSASGHCCSGTCDQPCQTCASGTCATAPDGANANCPPVVCSSHVSGWSGTTCASFSGNLGGLCVAGACDTSYLRCGSTTTSGRPSCASASCEKTCVAGAAAASYSTVASVCYTSSFACAGPDSACDATGQCYSTLLPVGDSCSSGTQCQSGFCSYSGHCCSGACSNPCTTCQSGNCQARSNGPFAGCTSPVCSSIVAGWSASGECATFSPGGIGYCRGGNCDAGYTQCSGEVTSGRPSCGSTVCRKACPIGGEASEYVAVGNVCFQSGRRGCPDGYQCDASGSCINGLLPLGNPCDNSSECGSGICSTSGHCCSSNCTGVCRTCSLGTCAYRADAPSVACAAVKCTSLIGGWNGTTCGRYAEDIRGFCRAGECDTRPARCANETYVSRNGTTCASAECVFLGNCVVGSIAGSGTAGWSLLS